MRCGERTERWPRFGNLLRIAGTKSMFESGGDVNSHTSESDECEEEYQLGYEDAVEVALEEVEEEAQAWMDDYERMEMFIERLNDFIDWQSNPELMSLRDEFQRRPHQEVTASDARNWWVRELAK